MPKWGLYQLKSKSRSVLMLSLSEVLLQFWGGVLSQILVFLRI